MPRVPRPRLGITDSDRAGVCKLQVKEGKLSVMHDLDVVSGDSAAQFRFCILMLCMLHLFEDAFDGRQSVLQMLHTTMMHVFVLASCCLTGKRRHGCRARLCMSCAPG